MDGNGCCGNMGQELRRMGRKPGWEVPGGPTVAIKAALPSDPAAAPQDGALWRKGVEGLVLESCSSALGCPDTAWGV